MIRRAVLLALCGSLLLAAAPAQAATLTLDKPCYRVADDAEYIVPGRTRVAFKGTGFTPGASVVAGIGTDRDAFRVTAAGTISGSLRPEEGSVTPGRLTVTAEQSDERDHSEIVAPDFPSFSVTATSLVVRFVVRTNSRALFDKQSKPMIRASGFYGGRFLYAHVNGGKYHRNLRMGKLSGPCGQFTGKRGPFLRRSYPGGHYRIQFDTNRKFTRTSRPKFLRDQTIAAFPFGGFR